MPFLFLHLIIDYFIIFLLNDYEDLKLWFRISISTFLILTFLTDSLILAVFASVVSISKRKSTCFKIGALVATGTVDVEGIWEEAEHGEKD